MQVSSISQPGFQPAPGPPPQAVPGAGTPAAVPQEGGVRTSTSPSSAANPAATDDSSGITAFAYGALGVDPPAGQSSSDPNYSAGQWTGAAMKVGAIVALFV